MNKFMCFVNCILLIVNALLAVWFSIYTIAGTYPLGSYATDDDIQIQFVTALIFEFIFFIISKIMSLKLKVDLSFKGKEIFDFVPKAIIISAVIIATALIVYSLIVKINLEFTVMIIVMIFSILLEIGITRMFKLTI